MPFETLAIGYSPALTLPAFIAINGNYSWAVMQLLGLMSIVLCLIAAWGLSQILCKDSPYDLLRRRVSAVK